MKSIVYVCLMVLVWVVNLFNGTGLGAAYQTTETARTIVYVLSAIVLLVQYKRNGDVFIDKKVFGTFGAMFLLFVVVSYLTGNGWESLNYLWAYLIVFLVGSKTVDETAVKWTGICYAVLGAAILVIYNFGTTLKGWNANSIGIIGLHSFLVFIIAFSKENTKKEKAILVIVTLIFSYLIFPTGSRSGTLFSILTAAFALSILPRRLILGTDKKILTCLFLPLVIAIVVVLISFTPLFEILDVWSLQQTQKHIFSGREIIWQDGLKMLFQHLFFGTGKIYSGYWHNSAIACLTAFGVVGYALWISGFFIILKKARKWITDPVVSGAMISFLALYIQQAVELGIFAPNPNLLPYVILGVLLGRIKLLSAQSN